MKRFLPALLGFVLLFAVSFRTPIVKSAPNTALTATMAQAAQPQPAAEAPRQITLEGFILKYGKDYILADFNDNDVAYKVANPDKASTFENKKVKVTGTLDYQTQTLTVDSIAIERWL